MAATTALLFVTLPAVAQTPAARPTDGTARTLEAARAAYEALPLADRIDIQDGLVWSGDYAGSLDGTFGRMTFEAITTYQARHRMPVDGILTAAGRKALAEEARTRKTGLGFKAVDDAATGVRIFLPTKLLGPAMKRPAGSRWSGRAGRIRIETFAFADGDLAALFERMKAETPGRKVVYSVLRPDWFVVSDESGGEHGYARFVHGAEGIRGFVFSLDASLATELDRVVIATAGRFEPFPGAAPASGATTTPPATPATTTTPARPVAASASGLVVAPGKVVTAARAVAGCRAVTAAGAPATVVVADAAGIATLTGGGGSSGPVRTAVLADGPVTVVASGESSGRPSVVAAPGELHGGRLTAPLQRGGLGAAVLDGSGALVALVLDPPDEGRAIAGSIPPASYRPSPTAALEAAVTAAGGSIDRTSSAPATTTGRSIAGWRGRVIGVDCVR
jgi:hypothetical protein